MIVYGTRATLVKSEYLFESCANCHTANSMQMSVFQRYAHVFWVPLFPIGKTGVSVCSNCRQVLNLQQMPPSLKMSYDNLKTGTKIPIWHFVGTFGIICIVIALFISDKQKGEKISKYILAPKKGDILEVKVKDSVYTLYKVNEIAGDTVFFYANKYQTNMEDDLSNLFLKEFATDSVYGISKANLADMNKKGEIIDIDRQ
jgi:hypothetical protein